MGLSLEQAQIFMYTCKISTLELRLMQLSASRNAKHAASSAETSEVTSEMQGKINAIKAKYGCEDGSNLTTTSEEYRQQMVEVESVENEYQIILDNIRDQMETVEERMDLQQETMETQLEVLRSEQEQWKDARDDDVDKTFSYFQ